MAFMLLLTVLSLENATKQAKTHPETAQGCIQLTSVMTREEVICIKLALSSIGISSL